MCWIVLVISPGHLWLKCVWWLSRGNSQYLAKRIPFQSAELCTKTRCLWRSWFNSCIWRLWTTRWLNSAGGFTGHWFSHFAGRAITALDLTTETFLFRKVSKPLDGGTCSELMFRRRCNRPLLIGVECQGMRHDISPLLCSIKNMFVHHALCTEDHSQLHKQSR